MYIQWAGSSMDKAFAEQAWVLRLDSQHLCKSQALIHLPTIPVLQRKKQEPRDLLATQSSWSGKLQIQRETLMSTSFLHMLMHAGLHVCTHSTKKNPHIRFTNGVCSVLVKVP